MMVDRWALFLGLATSIGLGCGGSSTIEQPSGGNTSTAGSGGQGATGGQGAAGAQGGSGGTGGTASCGGEAGLTCESTRFCDFQPSFCGGDDSLGVCTERPTNCVEIYEPVCGCDGNVYGNGCEANAAGVDINWLGGCTPPGGHFACGVGFCPVDTYYCRIVVSDIAGWDNEYSCHPYPSGCGSTPSCGCMTAEPCGDICEVDAGGNITLTCPGG